MNIALVQYEALRLGILVIVKKLYYLILHSNIGSKKNNYTISHCYVKCFFRRWESYVGYFTPLHEGVPYAIGIGKLIAGLTEHRLKVSGTFCPENQRREIHRESKKKSRNSSIISDLIHKKECMTAAFF